MRRTINPFVEDIIRRGILKTPSIIEIGFGSGWQTAILAYIVSQNGIQKSKIKNQNLGKVYAVERIKELFEWGTTNIAKYNFIKKGIVEVICGDATKGLAEHAPYDRIIAAAAGASVPESWLKELKVGGRLVTPVGGSIWLYIKRSRDKFDKKEYKGFLFVSLISDES